MFDQLDKYRCNDHFFYRPGKDLKNVCNAPADAGGVFIVYGLAGGSVEMIYIGSANPTEDKPLGSLYDSIVNGIHKDNIPRSKAWPELMQKGRMDAIDVYWYVTNGEGYKDEPSKVEQIILRVFKDIYGRLPKWNKGSK